VKKHLAIILTTIPLIISWTPKSNAISTAVQNPLVINGQVVNQNGTSIAYANVYAYPDQLFGAVPGALADSNGKFSIKVENSGSYRLTLTSFAACTTSPSR
jgi:hypothetical protein